MKDSVKKPIKIAAWCLLGVIGLFIVIMLGSLLVQKYIKKSSVPMFMGYASMIVITGSMNGTIDEGDLIIIKARKEYDLGDIVTYIEADGKAPVTHRLVNYGDEEGTFIAKGDANPTVDTLPVSVDQIKGEVVVVIPKVGLFFKWFLYEAGFVYALAIVAIIVAGVYFYGKFKNEDDDEDSSTPTDTPNENAEQGGDDINNESV
ncbi:MAG: signal peptidase I [Clostridiales bacterium]|nr:signal peptidase I [Clostridiales bacterium]